MPAFYSIMVNRKVVADKLSLDKAKKLLPRYGESATIVGPWISGPPRLQKVFKKEGSTAAGSLKGFSAPFGSVVKRTKGKKKKNNPSKPYGEPELFENAIALAILNGEDISEVVKKRGEQWVVLDDKTGSQLGSYKDRKAAWERQRNIRKSKTAKRKSKVKTSKPPKSKAKVKTAPKTAKKAPTPKAKKEAFLNKFKNALSHILSEGSMISYMFDQQPVSNDSLVWDSFVARLSKDTVMSDSRLKNLLKSMAKGEVQLLGKSMDEIRKTLEAAGSFSVEKGEPGQDEKGDIILNFNVSMEESGNSLSFAIKVEHGKPLILFPEETKSALNTMANNESKLLRAELMHIQETILDSMDTVLKATLKRDDYLKNVGSKISKVVDNMGPLEFAMLKHLIKNTHKGVR